jgi:RimJ/RimL family protein N-acetyltransferase
MDATRKPNGIQLRDVTHADICVFFKHQQDVEALRMAAFTAKDPADREAFEAKWARILAAESVVAKTIVVDGRVAGHVAKYLRDGKPEVTYWIGREFWGRGIATAALRAFLPELTDRPLHAAAAKDNVASLRVLEKCGFERTGEQMGFANARGTEIEEVPFRLE